MPKFEVVPILELVRETPTTMTYRFRGDFGWHLLQAQPGERCTVAAVPVRFTHPVHLMLYGRRLFELLRQRP